MKVVLIHFLFSLSFCWGFWLRILLENFFFFLLFSSFFSSFLHRIMFSFKEGQALHHFKFRGDLLLKIHCFRPDVILLKDSMDAFVIIFPPFHFFSSSSIVRTSLSSQFTSEWTAILPHFEWITCPLRDTEQCWERLAFNSLGCCCRMD